MKRRMTHTLMYLVMFLVAFLVLAPLAMLLLASFKTPMEIALGSPFNIPKALRMTNFIEVYHQAKMGIAFKNSMLLSLLSVAFNILLGTMTAYVLIRYEFRLKKLIMGLFMFAMVLPFYTTEIARFQIINKMGLYNTLLAPLVIYIGTDMMQIYIYAQYIEKIPYSLEEAAMIDGASFSKIFWKIIFPLLLPASSTLGIIKFVEIINDMYIPYLYMPSSKLATLSTALMKFAGQRNMDWGKLSAAILFVLLPTMIIYFLFQRTIMNGMTSGAIKE